MTQSDCGKKSVPPRACAVPSRIMLVTPARIAYRGLFGTPDVRMMGAWMCYVALKQPFQISIDGGPLRSETIALVPPFVPHRVSTPDREIVQMLLEAETVAASAALVETAGTSLCGRDIVVSNRRGEFVFRPVSKKSGRDSIGRCRRQRISIAISSGRTSLSGFLSRVSRAPSHAFAPASPKASRRRTARRRPGSLSRASRIFSAARHKPPSAASGHGSGRAA